MTMSFAMGIASIAFAQQSATPLPAVSVNSLGMKFVRIPAGEFMMGSDETIAALQKDFPQLELKRLDELSDEMPLHRVKISRAFDLGQTEVTRAQFEIFCNSLATSQNPFVTKRALMATASAMTEIDLKKPMHLRAETLSTVGKRQAFPKPAIIRWSTSLGMMQWPWPNGFHKKKV